MLCCSNAAAHPEVRAARWELDTPGDWLPGHVTFSCDDCLPVVLAQIGTATVSELVPAPVPVS